MILPLPARPVPKGAIGASPIPSNGWRSWEFPRHPTWITEESPERIFTMKTTERTVNITNSTVNFYERDAVAEAKDELLRRLFYARKKDTMGGYDNWINLLDLYYSGEYEEMIENISTYSGHGGATRKAVIKLLKIILHEED